MVEDAVSIDSKSDSTFMYDLLKGLKLNISSCASCRSHLDSLNLKFKGNRVSDVFKNSLDIQYIIMTLNKVISFIECSVKGLDEVDLDSIPFKKKGISANLRKDFTSLNDLFKNVLLRDLKESLFEVESLGGKSVNNTFSLMDFTRHMDSLLSKVLSSLKISIGKTDRLAKSL
jgi:hypothetical protein